MDDTFTRVRIPNELLKFGASSAIRHRAGNNTAGTLKIGTVLTLLGLASLDTGSADSPLEIDIRICKLLPACGYHKSESGRYSAKQRESLKQDLLEARAFGYIDFEQPETWGQNIIRVKASKALFGGLRSGGNGFSVIYAERFFEVCRAALKAESKSSAAIPLLFFLTRKQEWTPKGFVPVMQPKITVPKLIGMLGFHGKDHKDHRRAFNHAVKYLITVGVLEGVPTKSAPAFGKEPIVHFKKSPDFFPLTPYQAEVVRRMERKQAKESNAIEKKPSQAAKGTIPAVAKDHLKPPNCPTLRPHESGKKVRLLAPVANGDLGKREIENRERRAATLPAEPGACAVKVKRLEAPQVHASFFRFSGCKGSAFAEVTRGGAK